MNCYTQISGVIDGFALSWLWFALPPLAGYLVGTIPFGVIIARVHGVDLRKVGSGNVGATNVARALGKPWGYACFLLDMMKGFAPSLAMGWLIGAFGAIPTLPQQFAWLAVAAGCILGHVFNVWLGFRGGKGVATSLGAVLGIFPYFTWAGLVAFGLWIAVTLISRYVSLGSIIAAAAFVPLFVAFNYSSVRGLWPLGAFAAVFVLLIIVKHHGNIGRLLKGTENKIGPKKAS